MATSTYRNKNCRRPKKTGAAKQQRIKVQKNRLIAYGVAEAVVLKMSPKDVRTMLKQPAKIKV
jgi:hypothetical protein